VCSSSPPPAPDYKGAAESTAAGNLAAARQATIANRVNQITPWGSLTYANTPTFDQSGYDAAMKGWQAGNQQGTFVPGGQTTTGSGDNMQTVDTPGHWDGATSNGQGAPDRSKFMQDQWSATVQLSPEQKALLDQQNRTSLGLGALQDQATSRVAGMLGTPFNMGGLPNVRDNPDALDPSKLGAMGQAYDPNRDTNIATQAILSRLEPQFQRQEDSMRSRLANQGIMQGSEAYNNELGQFGQGRNDAYIQAALQGINLGMQQQGQTFGNMNQLRGIGANEQAQAYGQALTGANADQARRQQMIQEHAFLRSQPLNELSAIRSGAQVQAPQFQNVPQQQTTAGPNYSAATAAEGQYATDVYNAQQAQQGGLMSGLFGLGGQLIGGPFGAAIAKRIGG
jgi:hypothetical protein